MLLSLTNKTRFLFSLFVAETGSSVLAKLFQFARMSLRVSDLKKYDIPKGIPRC